MDSGQFLLTRPLRDVTQGIRDEQSWKHISTHTPLAGRDGVANYRENLGQSFLLTRPLRDVTDVSIPSEIWRKFLLTRPLRDVTDISTGYTYRLRFLLTRPLRDVTCKP